MERGARDSVTARAFNCLYRDTNLREAVGVKRSRSKEDLKIIDRARGMVLVQIRSALSDCAVPALAIDRENHELFLDWTKLFGLFFARRRISGVAGLDGLVSYPLSYYSGQSC